MFLLASRTWFSDRIHLQNFLFRLHPSIPFLSSSIDVCQEKFINKAPKDTFIFMFWYFIKNCWLTLHKHAHAILVCFNPRTRVGCDSRPSKALHQVSLVSIRAPTKGAMATHSQIHPIRALTTPLIPQNRRYFWESIPIHASLRMSSSKENVSIL